MHRLGFKFALFGWLDKSFDKARKAVYVKVFCKWQNEPRSFSFKDIYVTRSQIRKKLQVPKRMDLNSSEVSVYATPLLEQDDVEFITDHESTWFMIVWVLDDKR